MYDKFSLSGVDTDKIQVVVLHFEQDVYIGSLTSIKGWEVTESVFNNGNEKQGRN